VIRDVSVGEITISFLSAAAEQAERMARSSEHAIAERGEAQAAARQASERRAAELADHRAHLQRTLAAVAVERAARRERVVAMSPAEVTAADRPGRPSWPPRPASARRQCTSRPSATPSPSGLGTRHQGTEHRVLTPLSEEGPGLGVSEGVPR